MPADWRKKMKDVFKKATGVLMAAALVMGVLVIPTDVVVAKNKAI